MRAALDHRTVSLWPVAASPKSSGWGLAGDAKGAVATAKTGDPATEALAAYQYLSLLKTTDEEI
jgi:hypothetical protein